MRTTHLSLSLSALLVVGAFATAASPARANFVTLDGAPVTQGQMRIPDSERQRLESTPSPKARRIAPSTDRFILEETRVDVEISGVVARVRMEQIFKNPFNERLEAIYVFPMPENAAVDRYTFQIGETVIQGVVKKREEARREYEKARDEGRKGALLEQERPNIFTQSVANIPPGGKVSVRIEYVHPVKIDGKSYSFRFPMVVAPRYVPGHVASRPSVGRGWSNDTDQVPDASRITPPVLPKGQRLGNDIHITVKIDGAMPLGSVVPVTHEIDIAKSSESSATIKLRNGPTVANKDFVVEYSLAGERTVVASLAHRDESANDGYVMLMLQPKRDVTVQDIVAREVIFVFDKSGSMNGTSINQLRILGQEVLGKLNPQDTFRLIAFSNNVLSLSNDPLPATPQNIASGQEFIRGLRAGGGTNMLPALRTALGTNRGEDERPRYLVLMTDALVGNDDSILGFLRHDLFNGVRIFPISIGAAPNHYLMNRAAEIGRGFSMYVTNQDNAVAMAERFNKKTSSPILTDIVIDWNGLAVKDVIPSPLPDLHAGEPLVIFARYDNAATAQVTLKGNLAGKAIESKLEVELPETEMAHDSLAPIWARQRIRQIWNRNVGKETKDARDEITRLGLEHQLMTKYTSFIAVEKEAPKNIAGKLRNESVPTVLPEGMTEQAAPSKAFRGRQPAATSARQPTSPSPTTPSTSSPQPVVRNTPRPTTTNQPRHVPVPRNTGGDRGLRLPRFGGGGGCVEWVFLGSLGLVASGRFVSRRRKRGAVETETATTNKTE
jgi:Ca-activated chloride channel family protein